MLVVVFAQSQTFKTKACHKSDHLWWDTLKFYGRRSLAVFLATLLLFGSSGIVQAQMGGGSNVCEQCGMTVDAVSQAHFKVVDANGTIHYAECMMCAFKLLKIYEELNITTYCDWYGPNYTITVNVKQRGNIVTSNASDALVIAGGGCTKNRVVYNQTAATALLANNGTSDYLAPIQKYVNGVNGMLVVVPANATIMSMAQAALQFGGGVPTPSPTPTAAPTPTPTPTSTATPNPTPTPTPALALTPTPTPANPPSTPTIGTAQTCEVCGMEVSPSAQAKYVVTDENGTVHYVECFMCALNLIKDYSQVHIVTSCDWYGPNYTITVDSKEFGKEVTVSPPTAMFLSGGSCVTNRAAYNQTAADELIGNGYSQFTLVDQQYSLPADTKVMTVKDAAMQFAQKTPAQPFQTTMVLAAVAAVGVAVMFGSFVGYKKLKSPKQL